MALETAFISSVMQGYGEYRDAAATAIKDLGLTVLVVDDLPSTPDSPRSACLNLVREADIVVLLTGDRYGYRLAPSDLSATHQEFREAQRLRKPVLVFVHDGVPPAADLDTFRSEAEDWQEGAIRSTYSDPGELRSAVTTSLHRLLQNHARGVPDQADLAAHAAGLVATSLDRQGRGLGNKRLVVGLALGPRQTILRPGDMEKTADSLGLALINTRVMDMAAGCRADVSPESITLFNDAMRVTLFPNGDLVIDRSLEPAGTRPAALTQQFGIIEEDVVEGLHSAFYAATTILDIVDSQRSLGWCGVAAGVMAGEFGRWITQATAESSPNSMSLSMTQRPAAPVMVEVQQRSGIEADQPRLVADLVALLRAGLQ